MREARKLSEGHDFLTSVIEQYREHRHISARQFTAVTEILVQIAERRQRAQVETGFYGRVGEEVTVEGVVGKVEYTGKGKARHGRYVIFADLGAVVYDGPAILAGVDAIVRFTGRVVEHRRWGRYETAETVIADLHDVAIIMRPREARAKWKAEAAPSSNENQPDCR
jgi:hypothetical protein